MDIKEEVRRRIGDLTRFAYERGHRDGAQAALAEIESIATEDIVEQLSTIPAPLEAIAETKVEAKTETKPAKTTPAKAAAKPRKKTAIAKKPKQTKAPKADSKPKSIIVQEALQALLTAKGEARRDEVLVAAQAENPKITKHDLSNGLRTLARNDKFRVASDDKNRFLPA